MAAPIFKLVGEIFVKNDDANKNIDSTGKKAEGLGDKLSKGIGTAAKWGAGIATAAGGAATALIGTASAAADSADAIQKGAQKMGMSYDNYQKLSYALDRSGASIDNLSKGMKNITKDISEVANGNDKARETYDKLGISLYNVDGSMRSAEEVMNDSLLALADMTDETERNVLAQELLGNGYTELIPFLESGSEGIKELTQSAEDLGLVMSDDAVDAGAAFGDAMADVKDSLATVVTGIGVGLMPAITDAFNWVKSHIPEIQNFMQGLFAFLQTFVQGVVSGVQWLWSMIEPYIPIIIEKVQALVNGLMSFWNDKLWPMLKAIIGFVSEVLWPSIKLVLDKVMPYVSILIDSIEEAIGGLKKVLGGIIDFITGVFTGDWKKAWQAVSDIFDGIAQGLKAIFKAPINWIIQGINDFIGFLNTLTIPDWVPGVGGLGFHLDTIPLLAKGGQIIRGGDAIVGEDGAELVNLPAGATVTPLNENNNAFTEVNKKLDALIALLSQKTAPMGVYINGSALVGEIVEDMDLALGRYATANSRGV